MAVDLKRRLDVMISVFMILVTIALGGYVASKVLLPVSGTVRKASLPPPEQPLEIAGATARGNAEAPVVLIEYSDLLCQACGTFARDVLPEIHARFIETGLVRHVFRHFPVGQNNLLTFRAAEAAACAEQQDKFWIFREAFSVQPTVVPAGGTPRSVAEMTDYVRLVADSVDGLGLDEFDSCLSEEPSQKVQLEAGSGLLLGIDATPEVLLGVLQPDAKVRISRRMTGVPPVAELVSAIESLLPAREQ